MLFDGVPPTVYVRRVFSNRKKIRLMSIANVKIKMSTKQASQDDSLYRQYINVYPWKQL